MSEENYPAWPSEPPELTVHWNDSTQSEGKIEFVGPDGARCALPVTTGDDAQASQDRGTAVWHIAINGDVVTISPSIHMVGHWHSSNPVIFRSVEAP